MEAVSAGASVLTFLGLALKSAKAIHEVLSAIKDGPQNVQSLVNEVTQLQTILERLSHVHAGLTASADSSNLTSYASRCASDTNAFEKQLHCLRLSANDRRVGRFWKRLKVIVSENDLKRMRAIIHGHIMALNLELGLLQTTQLSGSTRQFSEILSILKQLKSDVASFQKPPVSIDNVSTASESFGARAMENVEINAP